MKQSIGVIVGTLFGVLVLLTCVTFAIFMVRKRHKSKATSEKVDDMNIYDLPNKGDKDYAYVIIYHLVTSLHERRQALFVFGRFKDVER